MTEKKRDKFGEKEGERKSRQKIVFFDELWRNSSRKTVENAKVRVVESNVRVNIGFQSPIFPKNAKVRVNKQ